MQVHVYLSHWLLLFVVVVVASSRGTMMGVPLIVLREEGNPLHAKGDDLCFSQQIPR